MIQSVSHSAIPTFPLVLLLLGIIGFRLAAVVVDAQIRNEAEGNETDSEE